MFFDFLNLIYNIKEIDNMNMDNKKKKKVTITINRELLEKVEKLTTNKSRLIEQSLLEYAEKTGIKIDDIIL